jgi:hypothetical protein
VPLRVLHRSSLAATAFPFPPFRGRLPAVKVHELGDSEMAH